MELELKFKKTRKILMMSAVGGKFASESHMALAFSYDGKV